jgi:hypothetical protein
VLDFADVQSGSRPYVAEPVSLPRAVDDVLADLGLVLEQSGLAVSKDLPAERSGGACADAGASATLGAAMHRLGSLLLAGVLLGVPRALETRAFGARRSVYLEVSPQAPELTAFASALERVLGAGSWRFVSERADATLVIDVLNVAGGRDARGQRMEAICLRVRDQRGPRRVVLHGRPEDRDGMAQHLLEGLDRFAA